MTELTFDAFAIRYCERQEQTPAGLLDVLKKQKELYQPIGWFMLEAQLLDSSYMGSLVILPYGPKNTYTEIPTCPVSPRGLASDMSVAVAYTLADYLPENPPAWTPPPPPAPKKKKRKR